MERETQENRDAIKSIVADRIWEIRKINNLTQAALAETLNIDHQTVSNWERGNRLPQSYDLLNICNIYGFSFEYIMGISSIPYITDISTQHLTTKKTRYIKIIEDTVLSKQRVTLYLNLDKHILCCLELEELLSIYSGENPATEPTLISKLCQKYPKNKEYIEIPLLSYFID